MAVAFTSSLQMLTQDFLSYECSSKSVGTSTLPYKEPRKNIFRRIRNKLGRMKDRLSRNLKISSKRSKVDPMEQDSSFEMDSSDSNSDSKTIVANASATTTYPKAGNLPKFCHECGKRFPVETAKFCVQCGVKRLMDAEGSIETDDSLTD